MLGERLVDVVRLCQKGCGRRVSVADKDGVCTSCSDIPHTSQRPPHMRSSPRRERWDRAEPLGQGRARQAAGMRRLWKDPAFKKRMVEAILAAKARKAAERAERDAYNAALKTVHDERRKVTQEIRAANARKRAEAGGDA